MLCLRNKYKITLPFNYDSVTSVTAYNIFAHPEKEDKFFICESNHKIQIDYDNTWDQLLRNVDETICSNIKMSWWRWQSSDIVVFSNDHQKYVWYNTGVSKDKKILGRITHIRANNEWATIGIADERHVKYIMFHTEDLGNIDNKDLLANNAICKYACLDASRGIYCGKEFILL